MKQKYILMIIFGLCLILSTSCNDRLDVEQHGVVTKDDFYKTDADAIAANSNIYSKLESASWQSYLRNTLNLLSGDVYVGGSSRTDNITANRLNEFTFDAEHEYTTSAFTGLYNTVYACNILLENVGEDTPIKKQMRAEAKVLRAYTYFYLTVLWGTPPLVDHTLTEGEYNQPNSTKEALWAFIEKDLTEAINSGDLVSKESVDKPRTDRRVTLEFAEAMLGKAQVFEGKYQEAAQNLDKVINSGKYALWTGEYRDMFKAANELNPEFIFQINEIDNPALPEDWANWYAHTLSWRTDQMSGVPFGAPGGQGWGFYPPKEELYDDFVKEEGTDGYRLNNCILTYDQVKAMGASVIKPIVMNKYFLWKNIYTQDDMVGMIRPKRDWLMMRYAEVLLLAAEAHLQSGNTAKATEYVNQIRKRAKLPELATVTMDDIKREKRLELFLEGCRFMDLVRWGDAEKVLGKQGDKYPVLDENGNVTMYPCGNDTYGFKTGKHELLPFPATEIRLNSELKQNPGW